MTLENNNTGLKIDNNLSSEKNKITKHELVKEIPEAKDMIATSKKDITKLKDDIDKNGTGLNEIMKKFRLNGGLHLKELGDLKKSAIQESLLKGNTEEKKLAYNIFISTLDFYLNNSNGDVNFMDFKKKLLSVTIEKVKESLSLVLNEEKDDKNKFGEVVKNGLRVATHGLSDAVITTVDLNSKINQVNIELEKFINYNV